MKIFPLTIVALLYCCSLNIHAQNLDAQAERLAKSSLIIDTHIDLPYRLNEHYEDISISTEKGDFDYPRAVKGGLNVPFMSIYIPAEYEITNKAYDFANKLIDDVENIIKHSPDKFMAACSSSDAEASLKLNKIALPMGMENGAPIVGDIKNLEHFWARGIRYITLTHSKSNHISDSSYDKNRQWNGLSDFGKKLVIDMNRLGVMVDISHVSDIAFYQVMEITKVPAIASHSSARFFVPGFERNMRDEMIIKLAENNGVIQLNYASSFLTKAARDAWDLLKVALAKYKLDNNLPESDDTPEVKAFAKKYKTEHPELYVDMKDVLDHIDHIVKITSIDNVGIGSDYEGVGDSLPTGLKDVSSFPTLIKGLLKRGYSESDIGKILGGNLLRVWKAVEQYAEQQGTKTRHCASS
jgi:membrane dipeptidase